MSECIICLKKITPSYLLCNRCFKENPQIVHELWYKELKKIQRRQLMIDKMEQQALPFSSINKTDIHGNIEKTSVSIHKNIGRPKKDIKLVTRLLELFDKIYEESIDSFSLRSMVILLKNEGYSISHMTIKNVLMRYRKKQYQYIVKKL